MAKKSNMGEYAFLLGVAVAVLASLFAGEWAYTRGVLVLLGIVVGLLNVNTKEAHNFLVASIALLVSGTAGLRAVTLMNIGPVLASILEHVGDFVAPAAVLIALRVVWNIAKD